MRFQFPKIYPILDSSILPASGRIRFLEELGHGLMEAGVTLLEYRNKNGPGNEIEAEASALRGSMPADRVKLVLDGREDLVRTVGFDGVHVDDGDVSAREARRLLGEQKIIGTFGGSISILPGVLDQPADYFAIGPVFPTRTKQTSSAPIGCAGVERLRQEAGDDVVLSAVGGITLESAQAVFEAGADMVAVSAAIFHTPDPAREYLRWKERFA